LRFEMHHLQASLAVLDAVCHCVHRNSATPKLKQILEVVMALSGNWYTTFNGSMSLPRVHSKNHFIFVFFHWLYVRWWQRTQIAYSVDSHSLSTFAAELSSYESLLVDAVTMFGVSPKRLFPSGQLEKATGEPILAIEPSPEWTPEQKKRKPNGLPSFFDFRHMFQNKHWRASCYNFNKGETCHCGGNHAHICCICGQEGAAAVALDHCPECSDAFRLGRGKSKAKPRQ
jgi:hypothetical protein